jgi:hypothetical protein
MAHKSPDIATVDDHIFTQAGQYSIRREVVMKLRSVLFGALGAAFLLSASAPAFAQGRHGGGGGWHGGGGGWHGGAAWHGGYYRGGYGWGPRVVVGGPGYYAPYYYPYYYPYYAPGLTVTIP